VTEVVVLTTAMLTFISFWRAAAIVLCDMASTMYYVAGIVEQAIGPAAPWFILAVMLFSSCVLAMYVEGSIMFVRGGVYRVVKEAMGSSLAKIAVATLMFGFVLTGPISSVSAGHYLVGLLKSFAGFAGLQWSLPSNVLAMFFALIVTAYFWLQNIKGIEESSDKALKIMLLTSIMGAVLLVWGGITLYIRGVSLPPIRPVFSEEGLGWLGHVDWVRSIGVVGIMIAIGHSFLGMTGAETLAQVYREMEAPKVPNLMRAAMIIFLFVVIMTPFCAFLGVILLTPEVRAEYIDNLLAGVALGLAGPLWLKQVFHIFIVIVGVLILSGAVNTSIVGANGVMCRLAEDGVLAEWFRWLHPKHGTTHRMIHLFAAMQIVTIVACGGDVYILGEAYAFGVIWSFVFMALAITALRFERRSKDSHIRDDSDGKGWKVPINPVVAGREIPVGMLMILFVLIMAGVLNLVTKKIATVSGGLFALGFYLLILFSEKLNEKRRRGAGGEAREKLNVRHEDDLRGAMDAAGEERRILIALRQPQRMHALEKILTEVDTDEAEIIVMHAKASVRMAPHGDEKAVGPDQELLFTKVISLAEKHGKTVTPLLVTSNDAAYAMAQAADALGATEVVMGISQRMSAEEQIERLAMTWGALGKDPRKPIRVRVFWPNQKLMEAELT